MAEKNRSERESDRVGILRSFHNSPYGDKFEVADRKPLGLEQQVTEILVATAAIDEHADVAVDGLALVKKTFAILEAEFHQLETLRNDLLEIVAEFGPQ